LTGAFALFFNENGHYAWRDLPDQLGIAAICGTSRRVNEEQRC
jgi:hypothetical protein